MRVSIFNCVSNAIKMLKFSSEAILQNAGTSDFDYIVVTWLATQEVKSYLWDLTQHNSNVYIIDHTTLDVPYVPNLRAMMNDGFNYGFILNDYCGLVNTDMYFGKDWLKNLIKYATSKSIVNSTHISPIQGGNIITANFGIPEYGKFDMKAFQQMYKTLYKETLETEEERGGWKNTNTMPYLIPKIFWDKAGPWELTGISGLPPDKRFFQRCKDAGAKFTMSRSSIVYHHNAVERRGARPKGSEHMKNE